MFARWCRVEHKRDENRHREEFHQSRQDADRARAGADFQTCPVPAVGELTRFGLEVGCVGVWLARAGVMPGGAGFGLGRAGVIPSRAGRGRGRGRGRSCKCLHRFNCDVSCSLAVTRMEAQQHSQHSAAAERGHPGEPLNSHKM